VEPVLARRNDARHHLVDEYGVSRFEGSDLAGLADEGFFLGLHGGHDRDCREQGCRHGSYRLYGMTHA